MSLNMALLPVPRVGSLPPLSMTQMILAISARVTVAVGSKAPVSLPLSTPRVDMTSTASVCWISSASVKSLFAAEAPMAIMPTSMTPVRARLRTRLRFFIGNSSFRFLAQFIALVLKTAYRLGINGYQIFGGKYDSPGSGDLRHKKAPAGNACRGFLRIRFYLFKLSAQTSYLATFSAHSALSFPLAKI